jgi:hypothetical protein
MDGYISKTAVEFNLEFGVDFDQHLEGGGVEGEPQGIS